MRYFQRAFLFVVLLIATGFSTAVHAEKRIALVIGNGAYKNAPHLTNPTNDAEDIASALRRTGFETITGFDLDKAGMENATIRFARAARDADVALFYYSGHAMQFAGVNYLMPVDANLTDEADLRLLTRVDEVVADLQQAKTLRILVLDSCRNNPLADALKRSIGSTRAAGLQRGLARIDSPQGMILAYATQSGQTAEDGTGRNSPYTSAFLKNIETPVEIGTVFRRISTEVYATTGQKQLPELSLSLIGEFYLKGQGSTDPKPNLEVAAIPQESPQKKAEPAAIPQAAPAPAPAAAPAKIACANPDALGIARTVQIDTTGGPGLGFEHFKQLDFLRDKEVVLTFDDGPWPVNTPSVLKSLADECTTGIFFPIGKHATYYPEILRQVLAAGHTVGSHTWSNSTLTSAKLSEDERKEEIEKGFSAVKWALGGSPSPFFRFPNLQHPADMVVYLGTRNIAIFSCDLDSFDFKARSAQEVIDVTMKKLDKLGKGIILLHDFHTHTAEALPTLLRKLKTGGYKVVQVKAKAPVQTLAQYDEAILKDGKLPTVSARPVSSVVQTSPQ